MNFGWIHPGGPIDAGFHNPAGVHTFLSRMNGFRPWGPKYRPNAWAGFNELRFHAIALPGCSVAALAAGAQMQLERFLGFVDQFTDLECRHRLRCRGCVRQPLRGSLLSSGSKHGFGGPGDWMLLSSPLFSLFHMSKDSQQRYPGLLSFRDGRTAETHGSSSPSSPSRDRSSGRLLTNCILGLNILMYIAQAASGGELLFWGAKVNSLIDQGQYWRLFTPSLLHANVLHLMVNSYSLNSIGPTMENLGGPKRFSMVYVASAFASSAISYYFCKNPSVGASGAIFGLVGALAVFLARHRNMLTGGKRSLKQVAQVIAINMVLGLANDGIDNWGHVGGLFGGAVVAWFVGPAFSYEAPSNGGQKLLVDRPPIHWLLPPRTGIKG